MALSFATLKLEHQQGFLQRQTYRAQMICRATENGAETWPPILGLRTSVVIALTYLRRNESGPRSPRRTEWPSRP